MVEIYTKSGCPYCAAAKEDFRKRGEQFTELDIYQNKDKAENIFRKAGRRVVPIIVKGEQIKVGFNGY